MDFKLPVLGENIESGVVVKIRVQPGQAVKRDEPLFDLETDKATVEVPSPVDGTIEQILIKEGDTVSVGQTVLVIKETAGPSPETPTQEARSSQTSSAPQSSGSETTGKQDTLSTPKAAAEPSPSMTKTSHEQTIPSQSNKPAARVTPAASEIHLAVIGAGPGGYVAAFLAADLGMKVTLIDKEPNPGGVCLFRGCIPSKALLHAAKILSEAREAKDIGIDFSEPKIDLNRLRSWKQSVVERLTGGLGQLCKARKIRYLQGHASYQDSRTLRVQKTDGSEEILSVTHSIVATGSVPVRLPFAPESERIMDSTAALELKDIPGSLLVIGGGYIGLELGTVYAELGSQVSVVEMLPHLLMGADRDLAQVLEKRLKNKFAAIMTSTKVTAMEETKTGVRVRFEKENGEVFEEEFDKILMAIGRKPHAAGLALDNTTVTFTPKGFIEVDGQRRTKDPAIFAIGDIAGDPMLAHKASAEGRVAVEALAGHKVVFEPRAIPAVVFTDPEIAWCGLTENEATRIGRAVKVVKFPWAASGRAVTLNRTDGLTKLIVDPQTERILGVGIAGVGAGELISEGVIAVEMGAEVSDLKLSIHPHPTLSETVMETAEGFFGQSAHFYRAKR